MLLADTCLILSLSLSPALAHTWRRRRRRPQGVIARSIKTGVPCAGDFTYPRANHTSAIPACRSGKSWMTAIRQLEGCISQRDHRLSTKRKRNSSKLVPCHIPPLPFSLLPTLGIFAFRAPSSPQVVLLPLSLFTQRTRGTGGRTQASRRRRDWDRGARMDGTEMKPHLISFHLRK